MADTRGDQALDAIYFDFDGVLVESADLKTEAFITLYTEYGPEVVAEAVRHHKANEGISRLSKITHCHRALLGIELDEDALAELGSRYTALVEEQVVAAPWVPGAKAFIERHRDRVPMFVISGTPQPELRRITARRQMDDFFVSVRGSPPRKEPIIEELLADHGFRRDRVLFIGDAMTDHDAAAETGLRFIGRVPVGRASPFPPGTAIVPDFTAPMP